MVDRHFCLLYCLSYGNRRLHLLIVLLPSPPPPPPPCCCCHQNPHLLAATTTRCCCLLATAAAIAVQLLAVAVTASTSTYSLPPPPLHPCHFHLLATSTWPQARAPTPPANDADERHVPERQKEVKPPMPCTGHRCARLP